MESITKQRPEEVTIRLGEWIGETKQHIAILKAIEPILAQFEGNQITNLIEKAIKNELPEYTVLYQTEYSWFTLAIWGFNLTYENRIHVKLGCFSQTTDLYQTTMSMAWFKENNKNLYYEHERLVKYREAAKHLRQWVKTLNETAKALDDLHKEMQKYDCGNLFSPDLAP